MFSITSNMLQLHVFSVVAVVFKYTHSSVSDKKSIFLNSENH